MELLFIRHGETEVNAHHQMHTQNDAGGLTALGRRQAERTAEICREHNIVHLYSSPESRARETAEIIGKFIDQSLVILDAVTERKWGEWEKRTWEDIKSDLDKMSITERYTFVPPGGESWQQMEDRLKRSLHTLTVQSESSAIIMHNGTLRALMPLLTGEPYETSLGYDFANASVTIFGFENGVFQKKVVNDVSHLRDL